MVHGDTMAMLGDGMAMLGDGMEMLGELEGPGGKACWSCPATSLCCKAGASSIPVRSLPARDTQRAAEPALGSVPQISIDLSESAQEKHIPLHRASPHHPGGGTGRGGLWAGFTLPSVTQQ